jgi:metal-responsive CopG/Arc/MetJ family transcriptional regulator
MDPVVKASDLFIKNEYEPYETIFLSESLCNEIDEIIKKTKKYNDREHFVYSAINEFISEAHEFFKKD